jgi:hypothetical protein
MTRERNSNAPYFMVGLLCMIVLLGVALLHYRPDLLGATAPVAQPSTPRTYPTLDAAALDRYRQDAAATDAEQQALRKARPTDDTSKPPLSPAEAAAQPGGLATTVPAGSFSPSDLGNRPVPTPTTMLTREQFDAAQASEEQNQLNTAASGLTPAQQMVQVHEAEQQVQP